MPDKDTDKVKKCPDCGTEMAVFKGVLLKCSKCGKVLAA